MKIHIDLPGWTAALKRRSGRASESAAMGVAPRSIGRLARALLREGEEGQAAVETTLVLWFVLLPLITGILIFGIAMNNYLQLTNAVSIAARTLAISANVTTDPCATAVTAVTNAAPGLNASSMTFTLVLNGSTYTGTSCSNANSSTAATNLASGTTATLTVSYPLNLSIFKTVFSQNHAELVASATELVQ